MSREFPPFSSIKVLISTSKSELLSLFDLSCEISNKLELIKYQKDNSNLAYCLRDVEGIDKGLDEFLKEMNNLQEKNAKLRDIIEKSDLEIKIRDKKIESLKEQINNYIQNLRNLIKEKNEYMTKNIILSIVIPTVLHGIYDFCIMSGYTILSVVFIVFVIFLYIFSIQRLKFMADANRKFRYKNKFCKNCGAPIRGDFCGNCGTKQ